MHVSQLFGAHLSQNLPPRSFQIQAAEQGQNTQNYDEIDDHFIVGPSPPPSDLTPIVREEGCSCIQYIAYVKWVEVFNKIVIKFIILSVLSLLCC